MFKKIEILLMAMAFFAAGEDFAGGDVERGLEDAERLYGENLNRMQRILGTNHPQTAYCLVGFGFIETHRGHYAKAIDWLRQAVTRYPPIAAAIATETDLAPLRSDPEFQKLLVKR